MVRLFLVWGHTARTEPHDAADPADAAYDWSLFDAQVRRAAANGLQPLVYVAGAPTWAVGPRVGLPGTWPDPARLARFATAAARRYAGSYTPAGANTLPRVRYWQVWNEPNAGRELSPQRRAGRLVSPRQYRSMVNAFATAVHGVSPGNVVVAGGLGPFGHDSKDIKVVAPMEFMSALLCVSRRQPHRRTCSSRVAFDVWAHNPYTNGGPTHRATHPGDVSIGDLPEMRTLLRAAQKAGAIATVHQIPFWVTEFSWDSRPPDPLAVPESLHARWVAEALYRMWHAGVSLVTWFRLIDDPLRTSPYQSGLYRTSWQAKPSLRAFRFPFVALPSRSGVEVWGRAPTPSPRVVLEKRAGGRWIRTATLRANGAGIFAARLPLRATGSMRAVLDDGTQSLAFSLARRPEPRVFVFGCGGRIPCRSSSG
jgi:hypothetical protein